MEDIKVLVIVDYLKKLLLEYFLLAINMLLTPMEHLFLPAVQQDIALSHYLKIPYILSITSKLFLIQNT